MSTVPVPLKTLLSNGLSHLILNWKSTAQGVISGYLAIFSALTGADFAGAGSFHFAKWFLISGVVAKVLLGVIQTDGANQNAPK